ASWPGRPLAAHAYPAGGADTCCRLALPDNTGTACARAADAWAASAAAVDAGSRAGRGIGECLEHGRVGVVVADASDTCSGAVRSAQGDADRGNPTVLMLTGDRSQTSVAGSPVDSSEDPEEVA